MKKWFKFNKPQINGFTAILDNISTAIIIAIVVGLFIESKIGVFTAISLFITAITLIILSFILRGDKKNE